MRLSGNTPGRPESIAEPLPLFAPLSTDRPRQHLTLEAAAAYATHVDAARVRAATEGRTLIYTIRWI